MNFPHTPWTLIGRHLGGDGTALEDLLTEYRFPIVEAFRVILPPLQSQDAEDLAHSFIAEKFLESDILERFDRSKGKLRFFLRSSIKNFLRTHYRTRATQKRGGASPHASLDDVVGKELNHEPDFSRFDFLWAQATFSRAMDSLELIYKEDGSEDDFRVISRLSFEGSSPEALGNEYPSWKVLEVWTQRRRVKRFRSLFKRELAKVVDLTVNTEEERGEEMAYLFQILIQGNIESSQS